MGAGAPDTDLLAAGGAGQSRQPSGRLPSGAAWIPDGVLRLHIELALGKWAGAPIWIAEMARFTTLDLSRVTVSDLTGLEHAVNLQELFLGGNVIVDLSPLDGLAVAVRYTTAPGLGNLAYDEGELWEPIATLRPPGVTIQFRGHGRAFMAGGYLNVIWGTDATRVPRRAGIDTWDVSDPRFPIRRRSRTYDELRQAHSLGLWNRDGQIVLVAQGSAGIVFLDVTDVR